MKKSVSFYTFSENVNYKEAMKQCSKAGYDAVELVVSDAGELNMNTTEKQIIEMKTMAEDLGLKISSIGSWNIWSNNLVDDDKKKVDCAKDILKKQLDAAQITGADTILVIPGWVGTPFSEGVVPYDIAYNRSQEALMQLEPYARKCNVAMGVENVWNKFLLSPLELKRFLDEINSEYVGAYFDVGNIIYIGYPEHWINILDKHIKKLHFCDCRFDACGLSMFVDLLEGDVNFSAVMEAARNINYDDYAVVEFLPNYKTFPYQSIINAKFSLDVIMTL